MRPILAEERARFDESLEAEHWLGAGLVGETMRYVALVDDKWCALVGFGSAALCVAAREQLIGWSDAQRHRRLRYVTNNQRFCVLSAHRQANLASRVLALVLRRLCADFVARWGHPVLAVETFTDPSRHLGTCYKASNFALIGHTAGYGRRAGRFVHHGEEKAYWMRALRRDATRLLATAFDHPAMTGRTMAGAPPDLNRLDLSGLLEVLRSVPDPRKRRGVRHKPAQILAIATLATLRGASSLVAIGALASELPPEALERLCCFSSPSKGCRVAPEESTIRRLLRSIDSDELDRLTMGWMRDQVLAGQLPEDALPQVSFTAMVEADGAEASDEADKDSGDDSDDDDDELTVLRAIAVDGKSLRGARLGEGRRVHLLSALEMRTGATIAQAKVDTKTNEITVVAPMLAEVELAGHVVTADALHTQRGLASFLVEEKGAHYMLGVKSNQPSLLAAAEQLFEGVRDAYQTHEKGHGRREHRFYAVVPISDELEASLGFPYATSFVRAYRARCDKNDVVQSSETAYYVSDLHGDLAHPKAVAFYVRGHWAIENRSHYVRDGAFDEDRCQVRKGAAPQALATLRNLAISILRLAGFEYVPAGLRWAAWDYRRGLDLLGL